MIVILKGILKSDELVIQPISAPKAFIESGYKGNIIAQRLNEEIVSLYQNARTVREDSTSINVDQSKDINMNVMGLGVSASNIIYHIRDLLGIQTNYISGHLTDLNQVLCLKLSINTPPSTKTIRIPYQEEKKLEVFDSLLFEGAKFITEIRNPYRLAVYYHQKRDIKRSLEVIRKLVRSPGEKKWAFNLWANIIKNTKGEQESIEFYQNALKEDPDFELANRNIGHTYFRLDSFSKAVMHMEKAYSKEGNWESVNTLAFFKGKMGETEEAHKYYKLNVQQHPMNMSSYANYGQYLMELGDDEELLSLFETAQAQNFESDDFFMIKSNYYVYLEKQDSAELLVDKALLYNPNNIDALMTKANLIYSRDGRISALPHMLRLKERFEELGFIGDGYIGVLNVLAMCYHNTGQIDSSFYYINRAIDLAPQAAVLYTTLAEAHYLDGEEELFYFNIKKALEQGWTPDESIWEDIPYNQLKNDKRLLQLFKKYEPEKPDSPKG